MFKLKYGELNCGDGETIQTKIAKPMLLHQIFGIAVSRIQKSVFSNWSVLVYLRLCYQCSLKASNNRE